MNPLVLSLLIADITTSNSTPIGWSLANLSIKTGLLFLSAWSGLIIIVTGAVVKSISRLSTEKLVIKWTEKKDKEIKKLSAEYSMLIPLVQSYSSGVQFTQPKRIEAIEVLWEKFLLLYEFVSLIFSKERGLRISLIALLSKTELEFSSVICESGIKA